jgi:hypothetical protein
VIDIVLACIACTTLILHIFLPYKTFVSVRHLQVPLPKIKKVQENFQIASNINVEFHLEWEGTRLE